MIKEEYSISDKRIYKITPKGRVFICQCEKKEIAGIICLMLNIYWGPLDNLHNIGKALKSLKIIYEENDDVVFQGSKKALNCFGVLDNRLKT